MADVLRVRVLDVGQGDAIVGVLPNGHRAIVIDAYDADRVLDFIESEGIREVVLFMTHSHFDHTRGAESLLTALADASCPANLVALFFGQDRLSNTPRYKSLLRLAGNSIRRLRRADPLTPSSDFTTQLNQMPGFGDLFHPVVVTVVHPDHADRLSLTGTNPNEIAGVMRLELPTESGPPRRVLLTADVQLTGISLMMSRDPSRLDADVLKYPHHGAWPTAWPGLAEMSPSIAKCTMADFLAAVMPSVVVFSVGRNNKHNHIHPEAIKVVDDHFRKYGKLKLVRWTQTTPNCCDEKLVPTDGPLAGLTDSGDIEFTLNSAGDSEIKIQVFPASQL